MKHTLRALVVIVVLGSAAVLNAQPRPQAEYAVGPQDVVTIQVFGEPDLSGKFTVEQDGTFTYPQLGRIKAAGLTLRALEQELRKQLTAGQILKNPQVAVAIENYRSQRILILGEVRSPGEYQLAGGMTLLAALARAGSTSTTAGREAVIVRAPVSPKPGEGSEPEVIKVDLADLQAGNMSLNIQLMDGDTINVPKAQSAFVSGQVKMPGAFAVDTGMTVLQIITLAGGLTDRGSEGRISILRIVDGKQKELKGKLTDIVQPGDTIVVKPRFF
jgi:polysaccharide export outer membrane protein